MTAYTYDYLWILAASGLTVNHVYQREAPEGTMPNSVPLLRYWNPTISDHFYTTDYGELGAGADGYIDEDAACYVFTDEEAGLVPLYRYWDPSATDHFYTTNWAELGEGANGYKFERIACYVWADASHGGVPFYRYWNPVRTDHFYTTDFGELGPQGEGWHLESIQCFVIQAEKL